MEFTQQCTPAAVVDEEAKKIFLGGLKFAETEESVRLHFQQFGEIELIEIPKDRVTGKPRGFGFITFKDANVAISLSSANSHFFNGRALDIKLAKPKLITQKDGEQEQETKNFANQLSSDQLDFNEVSDMDLGKEQFLANRIFVGGLPDGVTNAVLREYFSKFGVVLDTFVLLHQATKRPRGFGFVSFKDDSVVPKVLAFQKHVIMGKRVEARLATTRSEKKLGSKPATIPTVPTYIPPRSPSNAQPNFTFSPAPNYYPNPIQTIPAYNQVAFLYQMYGNVQAQAQAQLMQVRRQQMFNQQQQSYMQQFGYSPSMNDLNFQMSQLTTNGTNLNTYFDRQSQNLEQQPQNE